MYKFNGGIGAIICDQCRTIIVSGLSPKRYKMIRSMLDDSNLKLSENPSDSELDLCLTCEDNSSQAPTASLGKNK